MTTPLLQDSFPTNQQQQFNPSNPKSTIDRTQKTSMSFALAVAETSTSPSTSPLGIAQYLPFSIPDRNIFLLLLIIYQLYQRTIQRSIPMVTEHRGVDKMVIIPLQALRQLEHILYLLWDLGDHMMAIKEAEDAMTPLDRALRMFDDAEIKEMKKAAPSKKYAMAFDALEGLSLKGIVREVVIRREFRDEGSH